MKIMMKRVAVVGLSLLLVGALVVGCQTAPKKPTDAELINAVVQDCVAAAKAEDIDRLVSHFSDNFKDPQLSNKQAATDFLRGVKDSGVLKGIEIDLSKASTMFSGNTVTVTPVFVNGGFGSTTISFTGAKENGVWKIIGMDADI
jgi:hypothetical protein